VTIDSAKKCFAKYESALRVLRMGDNAETGTDADIGNGIGSNANRTIHSLLLSVTAPVLLLLAALTKATMNVFTIHVSKQQTLCTGVRGRHWCDKHWSDKGLFTARRIASAVLATAILSDSLSVRPSVTRRYCVKTTARSTMQFKLSDSKMCLVL